MHSRDVHLKCYVHTNDINFRVLKTKIKLKLPNENSNWPIDQLATGKYNESEPPIQLKTNWQFVQLKPVETNWNQNRIGPHWKQWGSMGTYGFLWPHLPIRPNGPIETNWSPIWSYRAWVNLSNWDPLGPIKTNGVPSSLSEPIGPIGWCQLVQMLLHLDLSNWNLFQTSWDQLEPIENPISFNWIFVMGG